MLDGRAALGCPAAETGVLESVAREPWSGEAGRCAATGDGWSEERPVNAGAGGWDRHCPVRGRDASASGLTVGS
jgi:hypothetical protein